MSARRGGGPARRRAAVGVRVAAVGLDDQPLLGARRSRPRRRRRRRRDPDVDRVGRKLDRAADREERAPRGRCASASCRRVLGEHRAQRFAPRWPARASTSSIARRSRICSSSAWSNARSSPRRSRPREVEQRARDARARDAVDDDDVARRAAFAPRCDVDAARSTVRARCGVGHVDRRARAPAAGRAAPRRARCDAAAPGTAGEHRRHDPPVAREQRRVADGVDAAVHAVQPPTRRRGRERRCGLRPSVDAAARSAIDPVLTRGAVARSPDRSRGRADCVGHMAVAFGHDPLHAVQAAPRTCLRTARAVRQRESAVSGRAAAQHVLQDAAVAEVVRLLRRVDPHARLELALAGAHEHLARAPARRRSSARPGR